MPRFAITGTKPISRQDARIEIVAEDASAARWRANEQGIIVDDCVQVDPPIDPRRPIVVQSAERESDAEYRRFLNSPQYRATRRAAFVGAMWAIAAWVVISWVVSGLVSCLTTVR
jgi:hypothetical protein